MPRINESIRVFLDRDRSIMLGFNWDVKERGTDERTLRTLYIRTFLPFIRLTLAVDIDELWKS